MPQALQTKIEGVWLLRPVMRFSFIYPRYGTYPDDENWELHLHPAYYTSSGTFYGFGDIQLTPKDAYLMPSYVWLEAIGKCE